MQEQARKEMARLRRMQQVAVLENRPHHVYIFSEECVPHSLQYFPGKEEVQRTYVTSPLAQTAHCQIDDELEGQT